jgi:hypothetical protein
MRCGRQLPLSRARGAQLRRIDPGEPHRDRHLDVGPDQGAGLEGVAVDDAENGGLYGAGNDLCRR